MSERRREYFVTTIYEGRIDDHGALDRDIKAAAVSFANEDEAGKRWSRAHGFPGYTSYGSLSDLPARAPCFAALKKTLDAAAAKFAGALAFDLGRGRARLDNMWVNVLAPGGVHSGHIHPHAVLSGTYYADAPPGAAAIRFEDPRLAMMMAAPPRRDDAHESLKPFIYIAPEPGMYLMWESWLRHEVVRHGGRRRRISVSFNYRWA
jgi:uncharacterized protein (TIGR02466 family)